MNKEKLEMIDKYLTFIYVTIKISVRDLYIFPMGQINDLFCISAILAIISIISKVFHLYCFLNYKGTILAFIIIASIWFYDKKENIKTLKKIKKIN